eukprot:Hpha_TRINITY_DN16232_c3_g1::TRINITY_DN16232_c3_g1_i1::g.14404::m.14404
MGEMMQGGDRVNLPEGEMRVMRVRCVSKKNAIRMDKIFWLSSQFGVVERMSRSVKHLKTYDFVQFQSVDACEEAIQYLNSKMLVDGKLSCEKSDHPELTFNNCTSSSWDCKAENNALKTLFETLKEATRKEARDWLLERLNQKQSRLVGGCNSFGPLMPNGAATLSENLIPYANVWGQQRFGDGPLYPTADSIAHSVVVHGCSAGITNADLYKLFSMSGNVKHVYNGKQEGVRVVQFQTQEECESVGDLMMLHGPLSLLGSKVTVEVGGPCRETTMSGGYQGSPVPFLKGVEQHTPSRILWLWGVPKPVQVPVCIAHGGKTQPGVLLVTPEAVVARFPSGVEVLRLSTSSVSRVDFDFKDAKDAQGVQLFHLGTQPPHLLSLAASRVELGQMLAGMGHASSKQVVRTESKVWESLGPEARTQMLKPEWAFDRESPAAREEMENEMGGMVKRLFSTVTGFGGRGAALLELFERDYRKWRGTRCPGVEDEEDAEANAKMLALSSAQLEVLRCESGDEVMNLLLSSERVFTDLILALDCTEAAGDEWRTQLCLRAWDERVRGEWEFRVFVNEGRVTAISQYNHYIMIPDLLQLGESAIRSRVIDYWHTVRKCIAPSSYVVDVVLMEDGGAVVIELNPFKDSTGGCLFDWRQDHDVLHGIPPGTEPEVRLRRSPCPRLGEMVETVVLPQIRGAAGVGEDRPEYEGRPWQCYLELARGETKPAPKRGCEIQ